MDDSDVPLPEVRRWLHSAPMHRDRYLDDVMDAIASREESVVLHWLRSDFEARRSELSFYDSTDGLSLARHVRGLIMHRTVIDWKGKPPVQPWKRGGGH